MTAPVITSSAAANAVVNVAFEFTVTTTGSTPIVLSASGLPGWVTFVDNGDGTATISGTPPTGISEEYDSTLSALNANGLFNQAFSLMVNLSPQTPVTAVTPITAALPTGIEISVPFRIDSATGGVAFESNYFTILEQHIATIVNTSYNERLMLPTYGSPVRNQVFEPIDQADIGFLAQDIQNAVQQWESAVKVQAVQINQDQTNPGALIVVIFFVVQPYSDVNQVAVAVGGSVSQVVSG